MEQEYENMNGRMDSDSDGEIPPNYEIEPQNMNGQDEQNRDPNVL